MAEDRKGRIPPELRSHVVRAKRSLFPDDARAFIDLAMSGLTEVIEQAQAGELDLNALTGLTFTAFYDHGRQEDGIRIDIRAIEPLSFNFYAPTEPATEACGAAGEPDAAPETEA